VSYSNECELGKRCYNTPAQPGTVLMKSAKGNDKLLDSKAQSTLRSGIGKLLWHMQNSRTDISQAVCDLARHMMYGDKTHMDAMQRCMQYLVCTKDAGLFLKPERKWNGSNDFQFKINRRSDSDYVKDTQTRCSISGYMVYVEGAPVMLRSGTQKTVALSSCEAELNAAVLCVQDMIYDKNVMESIGLKVQLLMVLEMDNRCGACLSASKKMPLTSS
jgi:hypothetical protein